MKIAIMGCGTVGTGVYEIIKNDACALERGARGEKTEVKYILDIRPFDDPDKEALRVTDVDIIAADPEIGLAVEAMGGLHPAFEFCMKCLKAGISVVTSNKLLVAAKAEELFAAARESGAAFRFGAAVCGGIPVIRTLFYGLAANRIDGFSGILNGTSNFILTKMIAEGASFAEALSLAQEYGYAEKDPSDDIGGADACRKTAILASVCFGRHIYPEEILTEGIAGISGEDVEYARTLGCRIKLLGRAERLDGGKIYACVSPAVLKESELIANVDGVFNALKVKGSRVGTVMLYGPGAGKDATASAVVADILDCVRMPGFDAAYSWKNGTKNDVVPCGEYETALYVRGCANDKNGALRALGGIPGGVKVLSRDGAPENELAFVTGVMKEDLLRKAIEALPGFTAESVIRVWDK